MPFKNPIVVVKFDNNIGWKESSGEAFSFYLFLN